MPGTRGGVGPEHVGDQPRRVGEHREVVGDLRVEEAGHLVGGVVEALHERERCATARLATAIVGCAPIPPPVSSTSASIDDQAA